MSVRSQTGHYFAQTVFPSSLTQWTDYGIGKINSDLGAGIQLLAATSYNSGDGTATAGYWDATADDMIALSLGAGSVPISGGNVTLASRPPVGDWFKWYLKTNGTTTVFGWKNITTPGAWVNGSMTALSTQPTTFNVIELNSNSNPTNADHEVWRCANAYLSEANIDADLDRAISTLADVFDWRLFSVAGPVEYTGSGSTITSQGGSLSDGDPYQFPGVARIIHHLRQQGIA
jgi:hypothetical protein